LASSRRKPVDRTADRDGHILAKSRQRRVRLKRHPVDFVQGRKVSTAVTDPSQPIRWGILGCGNVTETKSGPALQKAEGSTVTAVMRRDGEKAADYASRHNVSKHYDDVSSLVNDDEVDAIYVATPPSSHAEHTIAAAHAGKPVLCEKPMGTELIDCERMARACEINKVPLVIAFYRRALPRFEKLRELVQGGDIGDPRTVRVCQYRQHADHDQAWKTDPDINGGGLFVDMQTHTLDWLDHVFGNAVTAAGIASNQGGRHTVEDTVCGTIEYYTGLLAHFECCYDAGHNEEHVTINGTKGSVRMPFFGEGPITIKTDNSIDEIVIADPAHVHQPFIEQVNSHLRGDSDNPCDAASGWRNLELVKAMVVGDC